MPNFDREKKIDGSFGQCLGFLLLEHGTRPEGSPDTPGRPWSQKEFGDIIGMSARAVRYWLDEEKSPGDLLSIERALFGDSKKYDDWRLALRRAYRRRKPEGDNEKPVVSTLPSPQILHPEIHAVPGFTGREDLLDTLDSALWQDGGSVALTNSAAIHGLGGVGKSVLAQEYGWRNRERYRGVWWLRAEQPETLLDDLIQLGSRLGVPAIGDIPEKDRAAHLALDAIRDTATDKPWLLIYDNAESPAAIDKLTPRERAHLIVTSRWSDWHGRAEELPVDVFPPEVAADYLMEHTRHPDRAAAERLAEALGYLPLALSHARATCWASNLDFDSYRARLPELIRKAPRGGAYRHAVYATFDLAIGKAAAICPHAERLMEIAAFFAPDRIPVALITDDIMSESERDDALAALAELSLITQETLEDGTRGFSMHRLVQEVARSRLGGRRRASQQAALRRMHNALTVVTVQDHGNWPHLATLLPHALTVLDGAPDSGDGSQDTAEICAKLDLYFDARADYNTALRYSKRALQIDETAFGPDHPKLAIRLNNLAQLLQAMGRLAEAEPLMKRALAIDEAAFGPDHPDVATRLNNLAGLLQATSRLAEAEPLMRRALQIDEAAFGPDHPKLAIRLNNLATLLQATSRLAEAEPLMKRALAIDEDAFGPDHPNVARHLNNLAQLLKDTGRLTEAEPPMRRALKIDEAAFGPDHPNVAIRLNNLAGLLQATNRLAEAEPLMKRSVAIFEASLGRDHPNTKTVKANYAALKAEMAGREGET